MKPLSSKSKIEFRRSTDPRTFGLNPSKDIMDQTPDLVSSPRKVLEGLQRVKDALGHGVYMSVRLTRTDGTLVGFNDLRQIVFDAEIRREAKRGGYA